VISYQEGNFMEVPGVALWEEFGVRCQHAPVDWQHCCWFMPDTGGLNGLLTRVIALLWIIEWIEGRRNLGCWALHDLPHPRRLLQWGTCRYPPPIGGFSQSHPLWECFCTV